MTEGNKVKCPICLGSGEVMDHEALEVSSSPTWAQVNYLRSLAGRMADSLRHMGHCRLCAESSWEECGEGQEALQVLEDFKRLTNG